jgi:hypothetical protein
LSRPFRGSGRNAIAAWSGWSSQARQGHCSVETFSTFDTQVENS